MDAQERRLAANYEIACIVVNSQIVQLARDVWSGQRTNNV